MQNTKEQVIIAIHDKEKKIKRMQNIITGLKAKLTIELDNLIKLKQEYNANENQS